MNGKYDEIMGLPHHVSKTRPQMPMSDRASQFAPFAALTGYDAAIKETGRLTDERIELDEGALTALNMRYQLLMDALDEEPEVEITYFLSLIHIYTEDLMAGVSQSMRRRKNFSGMTLSHLHISETRRNPKSA